MKGEITLSKEEVHKIVSQYMKGIVFPSGTRIVQIKTDGYTNYGPGLIIGFTDEPEEEEKEGE